LRGPADHTNKDRDFGALFFNCCGKLRGRASTDNLARYAKSTRHSWVGGNVSNQGSDVFSAVVGHIAGREADTRPHSEFPATMVSASYL
jgi:hypothetical protein